MERVISVVTGAGGTLGGAVCRHLCEQQHEVIGTHPDQVAQPLGTRADEAVGGGFGTELYSIGPVQRSGDDCGSFSRVERLGMLFAYGRYLTENASLPLYRVDELLTWEQMFQVHCMSLAAIVATPPLFPYFVACMDKEALSAVSSNLCPSCESAQCDLILTGKGCTRRCFDQTMGL